MQKLFREIIERCGRDERLALCTVVASRGSTPQQSGARMLVLADGRTLGTLGGGCVEAEVRRLALELIAASTSKLLNFKLDHDYGWDDGLICGGSMDIYVQVLQNRADAQPFTKVLDDLDCERTVRFETTYPTGSGQRTHVETIEPQPRLLIAGGGHVGQALAQLAAMLDFRVSVIDDRQDIISPERFPQAEQRIAGEIEAELGRFPIDSNTFVVIVTRGHRHDGKALAAVIDSPAKYIGLIGSKRKVLTIFQDLLSQGASVEKLCCVHAPIGFEIGAETVPEIALSIAAELVAVRRGRDGIEAPPMKFDAKRLRELLSEQLAGHRVKASE